MLNTQPEKAWKESIDKWKELGPLNLEKIIHDKKIIFDHELAYKELIKADDRYDYFGQVNSKNQAEGFGRKCIYDGRIYEGFWKDDQLQGYGRGIYMSHNYYEGFYKDDNRHRYGKFVSKDGSFIEGLWEDDKLILK